MITLAATDYITDALCDLGVLRLGQPANADLLTGGKRALDQMIEAWLLDQLMVYAAQGQQFTLTAGKQLYTIGPVNADFTADRPTSIVAANCVLNTTPTLVRRPIHILPNAIEWAKIQVQVLPFAIPQKLYYDKSYNADGAGALQIWPGPQTNYGLELYTWQKLTEFPDLTTPLAFPPGYSRMIRKQLAISMLPMVKGYIKISAPELQALAAEATQARADVESYNAPEFVQQCDPAFTGNTRGGWNYATGE